MSERPAKPRGLRFTLRAVFVAFTVICVWLGWNVNLVQRRARLRQQERFERANHLDWPIGFINDYAEPPPRRVPTKERTRNFARWTNYNYHANLKALATPPTASTEISRLRKWLGDEPVDLIIVYEKGDPDLVRSLFPEAYVYVQGQRR